MRQSVVYENTTGQREYLCFVLQAAERCGKYEAVIVPLELGTADLWFHSLVMLSQYGLRPEHVLAELERREGLSGLEEKRRRFDPSK